MVERLAIQAVHGVGGGREWWFYNPAAKVGHLRVPLTEDEASALPAGCAAFDAGESGPERARSK